MSEEKPGFFKNHADTLAIIAVNITMLAIFITLWSSNNSSISAICTRMDVENAAFNSRMDAFNTRMDASSVRIDKTIDMISELIKERNKRQ